MPRDRFRKYRRRKVSGLQSSDFSDAFLVVLGEELIVTPAEEMGVLLVQRMTIMLHEKVLVVLV